MNSRRFVDFLQEKRSKMCFCATAIFGTIAYLYLLVNHINNNDMIACTPYGYGNGLSSGRWMLEILNSLVDKIWGAYTIPLFNGLLSILMLALTSAVLVRVFDLRGRWSAFAIAAITVTVAPIGSIMFFLFTAHFYTLALLMMAVSAWLLRRDRIWSFATAVVIAVCSLGIYQAYFPFFAVVLMLQLMNACFRQRETVKQLCLRAIKYAAALILSYLLYYLVLQVMLSLCSCQVSGYQGLNNMGRIRLSAIPRAYYHFFGLFTHNYVGSNATGIIRISVAVCLVLSLSALCRLWLKGDRKLALLATVVFLLLPIAANAFLIIAPESIVYTRMTMGLISVFYLPLISNIHCGKRMKAAICGVLLVCSLNYAWQSNGNYMWVHYANEKASNYYTTLFTRAKALTGYREEMQVVFIGAQIDDESYQDNWYATPFLYGGRTGAIGQINQYSRDSLIRNYLGYEFRQITQQEMTEYADIISQMQTYPNDGSLRIVGNMVFVKLEEISAR